MVIEAGLTELVILAVAELVKLLLPLECDIDRDDSDEEGDDCGDGTEKQKKLLEVFMGSQPNMRELPVMQARKVRQTKTA